jgi:hypothetical protein
LQGAAAAFEQVFVALYADLLVPILLDRYSGTGIAEEHPIMMGNRRDLEELLVEIPLYSAQSFPLF